MGSKTKIEWTDSGASWNPIRARGADGKIGWHCVHASDGCRFCYAERINSRLGTRLPYQAQTVVETYLDEKMLLAPLRWRKPRKIFVGSMTDLFGDWVTDDMLDLIFAVMALCPQHTFLLLTKRAERMPDYLTARKGMGDARLCRAINAIPAELGNRHGALEMPLPNVWAGVSVEDQRRADERIPLLLATPAAVRWVSVEPLLGPINVRGYLRDLECGPPLDWVVVGGESGPGARPFNVEWARSIIAQCKAASVPCFVKQLGANPGIVSWSMLGRVNQWRSISLHDRKGGDMSEWPEDLRVREYPEPR